MNKKELRKILLAIIAVASLVLAFIDNNELQIDGWDDSGLYEVVKVVDGDTIDVLLNDEKQRVRLLAIDAPESVDPNKEVECMGEEASAVLKKLLDGKFVKLINDESQSDKDKYGRLLRYVYLADGTFVNEYLARNGFAREYFCHPDCSKALEINAAVRSAQENKFGLWAEGICE